MTTQAVPTRSIVELSDTLNKAIANQARFEKSYTLARGKFAEEQSAIAAAVLANGDAIRKLDLDLALVASGLDDTRRMATEALTVGKATQQTLQSLDSYLRKRFATDDIEKGQLIAEIAGLHSADSVAEKRDEKVDEEITAMHRRQEAAKIALEAQQKKHEEAVARAEQDRARGTLKVGIGAALPAALFAFLKEHPGAFETAWKALGGLLGGGH